MLYFLLTSKITHYLLKRSIGKKERNKKQNYTLPFPHQCPTLAPQQPIPRQPPALFPATLSPHRAPPNQTSPLVNQTAHTFSQTLLFPFSLSPTLATSQRHDFPTAAATPTRPTPIIAPPYSDHLPIFQMHP